MGEWERGGFWERGIEESRRRSGEVAAAIDGIGSDALIKKIAYLLRPSPFARVLFLLFLLLLGCAEPQRDAPRTTLTVFAAASLTDVLEAMIAHFEAAHPAIEVQLNVAGTSLLARQIDQGAPADVFFSANQAWMQWLADRGQVMPAQRLPVTNDLVVVGSRASAPLQSPAELVRARRLALADPEHVPAGIYARQALECAGMWEQVQPGLVPTLDVRAALFTVRSGAADLAIVYSTDARVDANVQVVLRWPASCQPSVHYAAATLRRSPHPDAAVLFLNFVAAPEQQPIWEQFGFLVRDD